MAGLKADQAATAKQVVPVLAWLCTEALDSSTLYHLGDTPLAYLVGLLF